MEGVCKYVFFFFLCAVFFSNLVLCNDKNEERTMLKYSSYPVYDRSNRMKSFIYQTAYRYQCLFNQINNPDLLVYGTKSWAFPRQSVNLTISFPTQSMKVDMQDDYEYIITGFSVVLVSDTSHINGYLLAGGILKDNIVLYFESSDVTSIRYQFWLYGVPGHSPRLADHMVSSSSVFHDDMCQ